MEPARMRDGAVAVVDPSEIGLGLPADQHAQRLVLARRHGAIELVLDDLADVGHVVAEPLADGTSDFATTSFGIGSEYAASICSRIGSYTENDPS